LRFGDESKGTKSSIDRGCMSTNVEISPKEVTQSQVEGSATSQIDDWTLIRTVIWPQRTTVVDQPSK
jgi:hypothetical protein